MMRIALLAALLAPAAALAQDDQAIAGAVVLPMIQGIPDLPAEMAAPLAACIVAVAAPQERAVLAAAPGPSEEAATVVNAIVARPEVLACVQAGAGQ